MASEMMEALQRRLSTLDADADQRAAAAALCFADKDPRGATAAALMAIERRLAGAMLFLLVMVADDDPPRKPRI